MDNREFAIRSREEAEALQLRLAQYRERRCGRGSELVQPGFLRELFAYAEREGARRLFVAAYDLEITFLFMEIDICSVAGTHNRRFAPGRPDEHSVPLQDDAAFAGKMDTLERLTALALRCRAFWDKMMGLLFLLCEPEKYEAFSKAPSRKRFFATRAKDWPDPPSHLLQFVQDPMFRELDPNLGFPRVLTQVMAHLDGIRTAEAHGTGTLRKSALGTLPIDQAPHASLIAHWNIALRAMRALRRTLEDLTRG